MLDDILSFELVKVPLTLDVNDDLNQTVKMDYELSAMNNTSIKSLNIRNVRKFLELCVHEEPLIFELSIKQNVIANFSLSSKELFKFSKIFYFFDYLYKAQKISQILNFNINVNIEYVIPEEEYIFIKEIYYILLHNELFKKEDLCSNAKMKLEIQDKNQILEINENTSHEIKIVEKNPTIHIFGNKFNLPDIEHIFFQYRVNILTEIFDTGDVVDIELTPEEHSLYQRKMKL